MSSRKGILKLRTSGPTRAPTARQIEAVIERVRSAAENVTQFLQSRAPIVVYHIVYGFCRDLFGKNPRSMKIFRWPAKRSLRAPCWQPASGSRGPPTAPERPGGDKGPDREMRHAADGRSEKIRQVSAFQFLCGVVPDILQYTCKPLVGLDGSMSVKVRAYGIHGCWARDIRRGGLASL